MKKLLIAGYETQTAGYRSAFSLLGACADPLAFPPERHDSGPLRAAQPDICAVTGLKKIIMSKELRQLAYSMLDENYRWMR